MKKVIKNKNRISIISIVLLLLSLLIPLVLAATSTLTVGPDSLITVVFDEPVTRESVQYSLLDKNLNSFELTLISFSEDNTQFSYRPTESLYEGYHTLIFNATDIYGNPSIQKEIKFNVEIPALLTKLLEPSFEVASDKPFWFQIQLNRKANCRLNEGRSLKYDQMLPTQQMVVDEVDKTILRALLPDSGKYFIACNDTYGNTKNPKRSDSSKSYYDLVVDLESPNIIVQKAVPDLITDRPTYTTLYVESSEPVRCKYSYDESTDYEDMHEFGNYNDEELDESFLEINEEKILVSDELGAYKVYVQCEDKAMRKSDKELIQYEVDLDQTYKITSSTPRYTDSSSTAITFTTNKESYCYYSDDPEIPKKVSINRIPEREFSTESVNLDSGENIIYIYCQASFNLSQYDSEEISIILDTTPAKMLYVNDSNPALKSDPEYTFYKNKLYAKWYGEDNESGIHHYEVRIVDTTSNELLVNITTNDAEDWFKGLELNDSHKYKFEVRAMNNIQNKYGGLLSSNGITVDLEKVPPKCENGYKDTDESGIDCGASCPNQCPLNNACKNDNSCTSGYCDDLTKTCKVAPPATCNDKRKNGDESGIDCGGSTCLACVGGFSCVSNNDCLSGACNNGTCSSVDICYNNVLDVGLESGIDCGKTCPTPCGEGGSCDSDSDCVSGAKCKDLICIACDMSDFTCDGILNEDNPDIDGDGLSNWEDPDDDNDGLCDTADSPLNTEKTIDGTPDGVYCTGEDDDDDNDLILDPDDKDDTSEMGNDLDNDGIINEKDNDIDGDGLDNDEDPDDDNDGILDSEDIDDDNDGTNDINEDTDADLIRDKWEEDNNLNPVDENDAELDNDGDGLSNLEEYTWSNANGKDLDPNNKDTDGDGWDDKEEITKGTDPIDSDDHPTSNVLLTLEIMGLIGLLGTGGYYGYMKYQSFALQKGVGVAGSIAGSVENTFSRVGGSIKKGVQGFMKSPVESAKEKQIREQQEKIAQEALFQSKVEERIKSKEDSLLSKSEGKVSSSSVANGWLSLDSVKSSSKVKPKSQAFSKLELKNLESEAINEVRMEELMDRLSSIKSKEIQQAPVRKDIGKEIALITGKAPSASAIDSLRDIASGRKASKPQLKSLISSMQRPPKLNNKSQKVILNHLIKSKKASKKQVFDALNELSGSKKISKKTSKDIFSDLEKIGGKKNVKK